MLTKKRFLSILLILFLPLLLAGCFKKTAPISQDKDGGYVYTAQDLGFGLSLPREFEYFQTQRQNKPEYTDVQFFVPTSDTAYPQLVPGYADPLVVRVVTDDKYQPEAGFDLIAQKDSRRYYILFWKNVPKDWADKWSEAMKKQITDSFKKIS